jgi:hypothetical protein
MYDRWERTVLAGTAEENAVVVECKVTPGTLTDLRVYAPSGCKGLLKCRVFIGEKPIAPRSGKAFLAGEGFIADIRGAFEPITGNLPVLKWVLWNEDITWPHTPWMDANWISEDEPYERTTSRTMVEFAANMNRLLGLR